MKQYVKLIQVVQNLEHLYDKGDVCEIKEDRGEDHPGLRYEVYTTDKAMSFFFGSSQVELIKHEAPNTQGKIEVMEHYARGGEVECAYADESFTNWYHWRSEGMFSEPEWNWEMVHYRKRHE